MNEVSCTIRDMQGKEKGSLNLNPQVFGLGGKGTEGSQVHSTVVWQLNARRQGTHSALFRDEMKGGGKKPWRQKGTGRARAGSNTSPLWVGGGMIHAIKPRSYKSRLAKRLRRQALASVLSNKVSNSNLLILDQIAIKSGKTSEMVKVLSALGIGKGKTPKRPSYGALIVIPGDESSVSVARAARNIPGVLVLTPQALNVYDILKYRFLVTTKAGIELIERRLQSGAALDDGSDSKSAKTKSADKEVAPKKTIKKSQKDK